jgi:hypothetical protein
VSVLRVVITDDHALLRQAVAALLDSDADTHRWDAVSRVSPGGGSGRHRRRLRGQEATTHRGVVTVLAFLRIPDRAAAGRYGNGSGIASIDQVALTRSREW